MVKPCSAYQEKQGGFTVIELMITVAIVAIFMTMVVPIIRASIVEHRMLAMIAALKTDLEWARNHALSTNQSVTLSITSATDCQWTANVNGTTLNTHKMTTADLDKYNGVACNFSKVVTPAVNFDVTTDSPTFNGLGLKKTSDKIAVTVSSSATSKSWVLTLSGSGDLKVQVQ